MTVRLVQGDITAIPVDAIVNAANSSLMGGGGVDGAIHRAGGPEILLECEAIIRRIGFLKTGGAVSTVAGRLPARWVIHTVGPVWRGGSEGEGESLAACYENCLDLAERLGCASVSFPAISTGVYGYPKRDAVRIVRAVIEGRLSRPTASGLEIVFVNFERDNHELYRAAFAGLR